ncbi:hypothetical protein BX265_6918 [Streptomyces sp. TLI_235]|nr:hypothetical protein BX265_6918 [Streptomyces sp. TLI_235]
MLLDRNASAMVRAQAQAGGVSATLTMTARTAQCSTDMLVSVIPGASDEIVVLNSHTDGQNAIEENGSVVLRGIARSLAQVPRRRLPRTYVVVFSTVLHRALPGGPRWPQEHPALHRHPPGPDGQNGRQLLHRAHRSVPDSGWSRGTTM